MKDILFIQREEYAKMKELIIELSSIEEFKDCDSMEKLREAIDLPHNFVKLCTILQRSSDRDLRHYAAVILRSYILQSDNWDELILPHQMKIKEILLMRIQMESDDTVLKDIAKLMGVIFLYVGMKNELWVESTLQYMYVSSTSTDLRTSLMASRLCASLTKFAAQHFSKRIIWLCRMIWGALDKANEGNYMATEITCNILKGLSNIIPLLHESNCATKICESMMPLILKSMKAHACEPNDRYFRKDFLILENIAEYMDCILDSTTKIILEFCMDIGGYQQLSDKVRYRAILYVNTLIWLKDDIITQQGLVLYIVNNLGNIIGGEPSDPNDIYIDYFTDEKIKGPVPAAIRVMYSVLMQFSPSATIAHLIKFIKHGLSVSNIWARRAAFVYIAIIAETSPHYMKKDCLKAVLNMVKLGIETEPPIIRNVAIYALFQCSKHLRSDIMINVIKMLPIILKCLERVRREHQENIREQLYPYRVMLYVLGKCCFYLKEKLVNYLPDIMMHLFRALNVVNAPIVRVTALGVISGALTIVESRMSIYFLQLINTIYTYFNDNDNSGELVSLYAESIDLVNAIVFHNEKSKSVKIDFNPMYNFIPLLKDIKNSYFRAPLYNLIATITEIDSTRMLSLCPEIIPYIFESLVSTNIGRDNSNNTESDTISLNSQANDQDIIDIYDTKSHDTDDNFDIVMNDSQDDDISETEVDKVYSYEKEVSVYLLKVLAEKAGEVFLPYLDKAFKLVYKLANNPYDYIRKVCIDALTQFIMTWYIYNNNNDDDSSDNDNDNNDNNDANNNDNNNANNDNNNDNNNANNNANNNDKDNNDANNDANNKERQNQIGIYIHKLIKQMNRCIHDEEIPFVVIATIENLRFLLIKLKKVALPTMRISYTIFQCIYDILAGQIAFNINYYYSRMAKETEKREYCIELLRKTYLLMQDFGNAMEPFKFTLYFKRLWPAITNNVDTIEYNGQYDYVRSIIYMAIIRCFKPLGKFCVEHFTAVYPILMKAAKSDDRVRGNAIFGLGQLVLQLGSVSNALYPCIIEALISIALRETDPTVMDNIAITMARLIITNYEMVPLETVVPLMLRQLPLRKYYKYNGLICQTFTHLYENAFESIENYLDDTINIVMAIFFKDQYNKNDVEVGQAILRFMQIMYYNHRDKFDRSNERMKSQIAAEA